MVDVERTFGRDISIKINLNDVLTCALEVHIGEECHVIRVPVYFNRKFRRNRDNDFLAIRSQDFDVGLKVPVSDPMIDDRKLQKDGWEGGQKNILEHSHQRQLVSHFEPDVVTHDAIDQLCVSHSCFPESQVSRIRRCFALGLDNSRTRSPLSSRPARRRTSA